MGCGCKKNKAKFSKEMKAKRKFIQEKRFKKAEAEAEAEALLTPRQKRIRDREIKKENREIRIAARNARIAARNRKASGE